MLLGEPLQLGQARHRALVLGDDLAQHAGGDALREPAEVDRRLGVPRPLQRAALAVAQRQHVPGPGEVRRLGRRVDQRPDRRGAVLGGDAGRGAVDVVHRDGERRPLGLGVVRHHERQLELVEALRHEGHADEPRGVLQEERDLLRRGELGGHHEIALVLAVLVVDDDHHLAASDRRDGILDRGLRHPPPFFRDRHPTGGRRGPRARPAGSRSTRRSAPSTVTARSCPRHSSSMLGAPGPANAGRASSPPNSAGAR